MTLQTRTLLMVTLLLAGAVLATATVLTWTARQSLLAQTKADGVVIARLLARSAMFAEQVPRDVEDAISEQMLVEATIAAHLAAIAEAAGLVPDEINAHLRDITDRTVLEEFWITDETGHAYLRNKQEIDFTFSPDPQEQPQAHVFWPLLIGERSAVVQEARQREVDTQVFKYAGVAGIDKPRIVQVGYQAVFLDQLRRQVGLTRLVEELVASGNVIAINVVDSSFVTLAYSAVPDLDASTELDETDQSYLRTVISEGAPASHLHGSVLKVMAPITGAQGQVTGAAVVYLPTEHLRAALRRELQLAAVVAAFVLAVGLLTSVILSRRVTGPVARLTAAAAAVEVATFEPESLADVTTRADELGQLARVFVRMAREVQAREEQLKQQLQALRIEIDEVKKARQVAEITETEYFQHLREHAAQMRKGRKRK
jgi:HAMP domain-containing protein